jgi:hypothetical protein
MPKGAIVVGSPAKIIGYIPKYLNINDKQTI